MFTRSGPVRSRQFHFDRVYLAGVAQVVEQGTENPRVGGSTPSPGTMVFTASGTEPLQRKPLN